MPLTTSSTNRRSTRSSSAAKADAAAVATATATATATTAAPSESISAQSQENVQNYRAIAKARGKKAAAAAAAASGRTKSSKPSKPRPKPKRLTKSELRSKVEKPWKQQQQQKQQKKKSTTNGATNTGGTGTGTRPTTTTTSCSSGSASGGSDDDSDIHVSPPALGGTAYAGSSAATNANASASAKRSRSDMTATPPKKVQHSRGEAGSAATKPTGPLPRTPSPQEQGVMPYWKALQERGGTTSPKMTRSAVKKRLAEEEAKANGGGGGRNNADATAALFRTNSSSAAAITAAASAGEGDGGTVLLFSPPDQVANAERERRDLQRKERERASRVAKARSGGQLLEYDADGNPKFSLDVIRSPPQKKRHADIDHAANGKHELFDLSPLEGGRQDPPSAPTPAKPIEPRDNCSGEDCDDGGTTNIDMTGKAEYEKNLMSEIAELKQMMSQQASQHEQQRRQRSPEEEAHEKKEREDARAAMQDLIAKNEKNAALCAVYEERTISLQATVDRLQAEASQMKVLNNDAEKELTLQIESLRDDCSEKAQEIATLTQKLQVSVAAKEEESARWTQHASDLETQLKDTKTSLAELERKVTRMNESLQETKREKAVLEGQLEEVGRENLSLENENEKLQKRVSQITREANVTLEERSDEANKANEKIAQYEEKIEHLEKENADAAAQLAKHDDAQYETKMAMMQEENSKLISTLDRSKDALGKAKADANNALKTAEAAKITISSLEKQLERAGANSNSEKETLQLQLNELRKENQSAQQVISTKQKQVLGKSEEIEAMRRELDSAKKQISQLEQSSNDSSQVIANLQREKAEAKEKLSTLTKTSEIEVKDLTECNAKLQDQKDRLEHNMSLLQDDKAGLAKRLETFDEREAELLRKLTVMEEKRRCLHNRVIQLAGNIRVFVRVRPIIPSEMNATIKHESTGKRKQVQQDNGSPFHFPGVADCDLSPRSSASSSSSSAIISSADDITKGGVIELTEPYKDRGGLSARRKKWRYGFDNVYSPNHTQQDVWEGVEPLVQSAVDGFNVCLFAYGQTGSGKTHTMIGDEGNEGIIYRAVRTFFASKANVEMETDNEVCISVEMLEIYNEKLRDLLAANTTEEVQIKVNSSNELIVSNILMRASSVEEVIQVLEVASKRRCVKATNSNAESSRSHLVFTMHYVITNCNGQEVRAGKLHICDLAGSERLSKSGSTGTLLKETKAINTSLSCLSNVIEGLQSGNAHIPFRDSKLTYLLRDSLGGDSKTLAIVCCNPLVEHFNESLCSIRFAEKASRVTLKQQNSFSA